MPQTPNDFGFYLQHLLRSAKQSMGMGDTNLPLEGSDTASQRQNQQGQAMRSGMEQLRKLATPTQRRKP